jgi:hypothetical protein
LISNAQCCGTYMYIHAAGALIMMYTVWKTSTLGKRAYIHTYTHTHIGLTEVGGARPFATQRGSVPSSVTFSTVNDDDWRLAALDKNTTTYPTNPPSGPLGRPPGYLNILVASKTGKLMPAPPPLPPPPPPPPPELTTTGLLGEGVL